MRSEREKKVAISREIKKRNGAIVSAMQGKIRSIGWVVVEELNLVLNWPKNVIEYKLPKSNHSTDGQWMRPLTMLELRQYIVHKERVL